MTQVWYAGLRAHVFPYHLASFVVSLITSFSYSFLRLCQVYRYRDVRLTRGTTSNEDRCASVA